MADLESEATLAGDAMTAGYAAIERTETLFRANRAADAAAILDAARSRLGDGDGLSLVRRRTLLVQILRRAALAAGAQGQFARMSQLCGDAISDFERERDQVNEPYLQDSYLRERVLLYEMGVTAAWRLGDHELALARADLAKARGSLGWGERADAPPTAEISSLRSVWSRRAHSQDGTDAAARRAIWGRMMTAQARARRSAPPPEFTLGALQASLAPDEAIIYYYFILRETLLIYVITPAAVSVERRVLGAARAQLDQLAAGIQALDGEMDWLGQDLPRLGADLLPQDSTHLLDGARRLLICPHRILHHLPLHALDWQGAPLIERFAVSYVPNATSLLLTRPEPSARDVLAVGIDSFPPPLDDLPGAEQEASDVAAIHQKRGAAATVLLGPDASRGRLERLGADGDLARYAVIHLVTHGKDYPPEEPAEAALHLADGPLDAMDISQWTLHADLVALSACWSGPRPTNVRSDGSSDPAMNAQAEELFGDEVYGLQAAFFAAGARQLLGSLWLLDNGTGPAVMSDFHTGLSSSQPAETALQVAVIRQRRAGRSFYHWAPYKLITLGRPVAGTPAIPAKET